MTLTQVGATYAYNFRLADLEAHDPEAPDRGVNRRFLCPTTDCASHTDVRRHRSLSYNTESGLWNCKRCGEKGISPDFWTEKPESDKAKPYASRQTRVRANLKKAFAVEPLPTKAPPRSSDYNLTERLGPRRALAGSPAADYLLARGLPARLCHEAGVLFAPHFGQKPDEANRPGWPVALFPLRDALGVVGAQGRRVSDSNDRIPKSLIFARHTPHGGVFATPGAFDGPVLCIVEAPIDALTLHLCGIPAVATVGTGNFPEWLRKACFRKVVLCAHDTDLAGEKAAAAITEALALRAPRRVVRLRSISKDWNEQLHQDGEESLRAFLADFLTRERITEGNVPVAPQNATDSSADASDALLRELQQEGSRIDGEWFKEAQQPGRIQKLIAAACDGALPPFQVRMGHEDGSPVIMANEYIPWAVGELKRGKLENARFLDWFMWERDTCKVLENLADQWEDYRQWQEAQQAATQSV